MRSGAKGLKTALQPRIVLAACSLRFLVDPDGKTPPTILVHLWGMASETLEDGLRAEASFGVGRAKGPGGEYFKTFRSTTVGLKSGRILSVDTDCDRRAAVFRKDSRKSNFLMFNESAAGNRNSGSNTKLVQLPPPTLGELLYNIGGGGNTQYHGRTGWCAGALNRVIIGMGLAETKSMRMGMNG